MKCLHSVPRLMGGEHLLNNVFMIYLLDLTIPKPGLGYLGPIIIAFLSG